VLVSALLALLALTTLDSHACGRETMRDRAGAGRPRKKNQFLVQPPSPAPKKKQRKKRKPAATPAAAPAPEPVVPAPAEEEVDPEQQTRRYKQIVAAIDLSDRRDQWERVTQDKSSDAVLAFITEAAGRMEPANVHRILDADVVSTAQSLCADLDAAAILEAFKSVKHKRLEHTVEQAALRTSLKTQRKAATPDIDKFVRRSLQRGPSSGVSAMSDGSQKAVRRASEDRCLDGVLNAASDVVANGSHFRDGPADNPCRLEEVLENCSDDDEGPAGRRQVAAHILPDCLETLGRYVGKGGHANARAALGSGPPEFIDRVCKHAAYRVAAMDKENNTKED
jgi:hypothetical protein